MENPILIKNLLIDPSLLNQSYVVRPKKKNLREEKKKEEIRNPSSISKSSFWSIFSGLIVKSPPKSKIIPIDNTSFTPFLI